MPDGSTTITSKGQKHHYIPVFYLKQWAGADGRLFEFSRKHNAVVSRQTHPRGTGYVPGLNTFPLLPPVLADFLENRFFQRVDNDASIALQKLSNDNLDIDYSAWARFIMTLIYRSPEGMARVAGKVAVLFQAELDTNTRTHYAERRTESDPETFDEFLAALTQADTDEANLRALTKVMDSENVGNLMYQMRWAVIKADGFVHKLLTSDRPFTISNGLGQPNAMIVMPISPVRIFAMAHNADLLQAFSNKIQSGGGVQLLNQQVVRQARKYAWAIDNASLKFIEGRLGDKIRWSPWE